MQVDGASGFATFGECPYDQRLATAGITGDEDSRDRRRMVTVLGFDVPARVFLDPELLDESFVNRVYEAHCQQDQVGGDFKLGPG